MNFDAFLPNLRSLSELILRVPVGTGAFYLLVGLVLFALLVGGKLMLAAFGGGNRGFVPVLLAQAAVVALALLGATLVQTLLAPHIQSVPLLNGSLIAGAAIGGFIGVVLLSRMLMGVAPGVGLIVTLLTLAVAYAVLWGGQQLLVSIEHGQDQIEEIRDRIAE